MECKIGSKMDQNVKESATVNEPLYNTQDFNQMIQSVLNSNEEDSPIENNHINTEDSLLTDSSQLCDLNTFEEVKSLLKKMERGSFV